MKAELIRKPLADEIAQWLNQEIESGRFPTGDRLPSERELCEQFSVSRAVVREALSRLKSEGLITARPGSGIFVSERGQRNSFRLHDVSLTEEQSLGHILELLVTFEVAATRLAASRRTSLDLKRINQALVSMEYAIVHDRLGDDEDFAFHQAIVDATHNPHFKALNEYLENSVRGLIRKARSNTAARYGKLIKAVQQEHQAIYQAIESRDPIAAALAAETHLRNAGKRLNMYVDN